jgi:hypothetical protein
MQIPKRDKVIYERLSLTWRRLWFESVAALNFLTVLD